MKQADPNRDYRAFVAQGYDDCAPAFNAARSASEEGLVAGLRARLPRGGRVLDLGCGGLPVSRHLADEHEIIGVDISHAQIASARKHLPAGRFALGDMTTVAFAPGSFDAVVSFYAIFHTPRKLHDAIIRRMYDWLRPGGYLLASFGTDNEAGYTEEFFGVEMFWSNFNLEHYVAALTSCGFDVLDHRSISHGYGADADPESHPLLFAQKR